MAISGNGGANGGVSGGTDVGWWRQWFLSPAFVFFMAALLLLGSIGTLYAWLIFTPFRTPYIPSISHGCQEDNEGSWSIGVFYGDSPFSLQPIEDVS